MYGIFANIGRKNHPNVGKYTSTMEPMGYVLHCLVESSISTESIELGKGYFFFSVDVGPLEDTSKSERDR